MSEKREAPASKIYYNEVTENLDHKKEVVFSVESQTDDGAKKLFNYLRSEFKEKCEE